MRNLLNPIWIFIVNTLPIVLLFFLFYGEFNIIKSFLNQENIYLWKIFSWIFGILGLLNFAYALYLTVKKQNVSFWYGGLALLLYIPLIYLYGYNADKIIPFSVPQWMIEGNMILYVGTFLMPTLAYSLFILVYHFTSGVKEYKAWKNFLIAIVIPISWYLFSQIILPLWKPIGDNFEIHMLLILIITGTLVFLFFIIRGTFIIVSKKAVVWQKYQLAWKIPISIVLPLIGLAVNNGRFLNDFDTNNSGVFGDFNSCWFYTLAILNGIFLCLPSLENKVYRLFLFIGRSITFAYTLYFFLVFLPFLPFSIIAIAAVGTGFLMLSPLLLFVLQIIEFSKDLLFLKKYFSKSKIWIISFLSFLVIPLFITVSFLKDKRILNQTLDYIYAPDFSKSYVINKVSLQKTLNHVKHHKDRNGDIIFGGQMPYLSSYFNWLVLDNLTLSDSKINMIEKIFFGTTSYQVRQDSIQNDDVKITNISTKSFFDKTQNAWKSWVDFEITNNSDNNWFSEYATTINLPEGAWISDYYLYVGNKKEMGILAEKKSAMWVFSNIRNENKDPGILYYLTGNKVAFRVFPFSKNEVRKTGIEILHKEPINFTIDNNFVKLGNDEEKIINENEKSDEVIYISAKQKRTLKQLQRKPYFHFLVDVSIDKDKYFNEFVERIDNTLKKNPRLAKNARITFVNSYVNTIPLKSGWKQFYERQTFEGGFYLDRAVKTTLFKAYKEQTNSYPVLVVVTDNIQKSVLDKDFSDFKMAFPDDDLFYNFNEKGEFKSHSLMSNSIEQLSDSCKFTFDHSVLEFKIDKQVFYLPNNNQPSIILRNDIFQIEADEIKEKNWKSALLIHGKWNSHTLHPEISNNECLNLVKYSFISKVMTPMTSYLVVENEAQKKVLKKKQKQVLSSNMLLDIGEETQRMSEPGLLILTILLGFVFCIKRKQQCTR
nr:MSEP-CTERM sorting domain-containing protein [uncultured Flavobacterium sp.]